MINLISSRETWQQNNSNDVDGFRPPIFQSQQISGGHQIQVLINMGHILIIVVINISYLKFMLLINMGYILVIDVVNIAYFMYE